MTINDSGRACCNYKQNYDYDPNSPESVISLSMLQEENLDESLAFADLVQDNFSSAKRFDRSVKQNNFLVLARFVFYNSLLSYISNQNYDSHYWTQKKPICYNGL